MGTALLSKRVTVNPHESDDGMNPCRGPGGNSQGATPVCASTHPSLQTMGTRIVVHTLSNRVTQSEVHQSSKAEWGQAGTFSWCEGLTCRVDTLCEAEPAAGAAADGNNSGALCAD